MWLGKVAEEGTTMRVGPALNTAAGTPESAARTVLDAWRQTGVESVPTGSRGRRFSYNTTVGERPSA